MRAAYDDHGTAGLAVSPTEREQYGLLFQLWTSKVLPDPSRLVPLSGAPQLSQGVELVLELPLEQASRSSEVLQEQEGQRIQVVQETLEVLLAQGGP